MPQSKEVHKEYMKGYRAKRKKGIITMEEILAPHRLGERSIPDVIEEGSQPTGVHSEGSQDWETMPLEDIKSALPRDIVDYAESVGQRYGRIEERLRRAYKYQVWHDENFINGVHRGSKYRQFIKGDLLDATG